MQNLANATNLEESSPFTMLAYTSTVRELIDDPDSPYKLAFDLNTKAHAFYVTKSDLVEKKAWELTDHETTISYLKSEPIKLNRDNKYVKNNMIRNSGEDILNLNSRMPGYYVFVENETVFGYWREQLKKNQEFPLE